MLKPILVAVFISAVILVECAFAYLLIPSTADLETWAKKKAGDHAAADEHGQEGAGEHKSEHAAEHEAEVELGKFNVIVHKPADNLTMRVNFHLIGTVPEKEHKEFEELYAKCEHRLGTRSFLKSANPTSRSFPTPVWPCSKGRFWRKVTSCWGSRCCTRSCSATLPLSSNSC